MPPSRSAPIPQLGQEGVLIHLQRSRRKTDASATARRVHLATWAGIASHLRTLQDRELLAVVTGLCACGLLTFFESQCSPFTTMSKYICILIKTGIHMKILIVLRIEVLE